MKKNNKIEKFLKTLSLSLKLLEINKPLLSKYCSFENNFQFLAAISFRYSEK